ncbi:MULTISPECIES: NIPSNAP family protein [Microbacterium]|uniref:NIPSNAP domain-containing protein n=1 Tax=Microbacterium azadirachtae TaxID=582680 RepID=A0A0F0LQL1_9MICO|nr:MULTISPECIES: NIPSNAP family protein [Microbacterium]KJL34560.1 hypothetical protein RS86_00815 [Microbacterium azadirachtae]PRB05065.1 NIPSNAP family protein [Microbacterium sp. MYb64]
MTVLEIRSYVLHPGARQSFHDLFHTKVMPMLADQGIRVVRYGASEHDDVSYVLMRAFDSTLHRDEQEDRFYGSALWREGYREEVLAMIASYQEVVLTLDDATVDALGA